VIDLGVAEQWIDLSLAATGRERSGPVESFRSRPWGEVLRAETSDGTVWLKEPRGATAFEVPLYWLLADASPEAILEPLAVDEERGWVLLPDGGRSLGERAEGDDLVAGMTAALERYAELQIALAPRVGELLEIGIADMRPGAMPSRFEEALEAGKRYAQTSNDRADRESLERIEAFRGTYAKWCGELESRPGGASLDHNDLHPWNVLGSPDAEGGIRFYDWGDSVVAHPFASALVPLGMAARWARGAVEALRDAYLGPFSGLGAHRELVETLELACRVAKVARALTWERALSSGDATSSDRDFTRAPLESLESILDESYLGNT
jgi:Phosphotransferase enzyme family